MSVFDQREVVIATKHGKENTIQTILAKHFSIVKREQGEIDTDQFGTFSGEVERTKTPWESLRAKCDLAYEKTNCDLVISSEGSFGTHPTLFFSAANEELVMLKDYRNSFEIIGKHLTTETNFGKTETRTWEEAKHFAHNHLFPSHALIVRWEESENGQTQLFKGITNTNELENIIAKGLRSTEIVSIETDMRACYNPTRLKAIQQATENLIERMLSVCPECATPGYWITKWETGLPCQLCTLPTKGIRLIIYECSKCTYTEQKPPLIEKRYEDPMYCDYCNP